ncbi:MAG TPA: hypothetical protein VFR35_15700, partial [Actinoplanes sp.]|nr:hypothetical protein [Actinoplanes sp.]
MRESDEGDEVVTARMRTVFEPRPPADHRVAAGGTPPVPGDRGSRPDGSRPDGSRPDGSRPDEDGTWSAFEDRTPLAWSDLVPSWPEYAELEPRAEPRRPPVTTSS